MKFGAALDVIGGSIMPTRGGEPGAVPHVDDNVSAQVRIALSEALTELRRLTQDPFFDGVDQALADLCDTTIGPGFGVDTVCSLRQWSADYQRVAIELEAAARCCRLAEREINQRVDALLADGSAVDESAADNRSRVGLLGGLRDIFRWGNADPRRSREGPSSAERQTEPLPPSPAAGYPAPAAAVPEADIATSALGPLEVRVAGQRVPRWTSMKARAVFQYLLIHQDRPTRRDVLMALQWPDHSHESARNNLNVALYNLRGTLDGLGSGVQPVLYRDGCYILNPGLTWWIDRNEFLSALDDARLGDRAGRPETVMDSYHRAIQLYRGPLFEDDGAGEWYLPEQRRLKDLYGQALEYVAEIHFQRGELPEALQFSQLAIRNDPCSEAVHRLLMRCYASQHQQQLVSRQYRVCTATLRDELRVPPSDETTQLFRELI
jgi:DNA-binding SARP family transcriptional activator